MVSRRSFARMLAATSLISPWRSPRAQLSTIDPEPQFSCMLWTLEKRAPLDRCLEIVAAAGYSGVELVGEFARWSPGEQARILGRMHALGLVVDAMSGVKAGFCVPSEADLFHTQFAAQMAAARALGSRVIILLSGKRIDGMPAEVQTRTATENLKRAADTAAAAGIDVLIEPIDLLEDPHVFLTTVVQGFALARAVNRPNVRVLYDLYHEQRGAGNLIEKLENNIDLVGLVHVADVPGRHEPGTGEIDYANVYSALARLRYSRFIAMEFYPTGDAENALRTARTAVEQAYGGSQAAPTAHN